MPLGHLENRDLTDSPEIMKGEGQITQELPVYPKRKREIGKVKTQPW